MYKPFVCRALFQDEDERSMRFGVSAGNELEVKEAMDGMSATKG
jgi:hypothetical protein